MSLACASIELRSILQWQEESRQPSCPIESRHIGLGKVRSVESQSSRGAENRRQRDRRYRLGKVRSLAVAPQYECRA